MTSCDSLTVFLLLGCCAHTVSLLASSFVEEEHQTWYFLSVTLQLLLGLYFTVQYLQTGHKEEALDVVEPTLAPKDQGQDYANAGQEEDLEDNAYEMYYQKEEAAAEDTDAFKQFITGVRKKAMLGCAAAVLLLLLLSRVARSWNRTGDKWAHLPDVGDWLVK